jgi:3-oxoacyl-[acyl-carrier protein] reductase
VSISAIDSIHLILVEILLNFHLLLILLYSKNVYQIIEGLYPNEEMTFSGKENDFMTTNLPQSEIQRFIKPVEIGRITTFVCSPYASAFKGSPIRIDGGMVPTIF